MRGKVEAGATGFCPLISQDLGFSGDVSTACVISHLQWLMSPTAPILDQRHPAKALLRQSEWLLSLQRKAMCLSVGDFLQNILIIEIWKKSSSSNNFSRTRDMLVATKLSFSTNWHDILIKYWIFTPTRTGLYRVIYICVNLFFMKYIKVSLYWVLFSK